MSSFPNTNSLVGYERFVLFCFVFCQILVWICGQYFLCTRLLNRLEASCGHWMAHMNFGDQLRHLLTECPYCIFMAVSLAQHLVWPMLSCRVFPAPSVDVNLCLKIQKKWNKISQHLEGLGFGLSFRTWPLTHASATSVLHPLLIFSLKFHDPALKLDGVIREEQGHGCGSGACLCGRGCLLTLVIRACWPSLFSLLAEGNTCSLKGARHCGHIAEKGAEKEPLWSGSQRQPLLTVSCMSFQIFLWIWAFI